jgi:hypothetical protein
MKSIGVAMAVICMSGVTAQSTRSRHVVGSPQYHDSWVERPE